MADGDLSGVLVRFVWQAGFITGDWSVEYPPAAEALSITGSENAGDGGTPLVPATRGKCDIFPAAAMRDSAFR